jgi:hypothetical protein
MALGKFAKRLSGSRSEVIAPRLGLQGDGPAVEAAARFAVGCAIMLMALASGVLLGLACGLAMLLGLFAILLFRQGLKLLAVI